MSLAGPLRVVVFGPARSGKTALAAVLNHHVAARGVRLLDADGQAAGKLMLGEHDPGGLSAELLAADALVLVVDAAASPEVIDQTFHGFAGFLHRLEAGRSFTREVGGLPVVLTLAKCDALHRPGDEPSDWLRRVEERKAEVRTRFEDRFTDELTPPADGYLRFGSLELHLAATAKAIPDGPAFAGYADPGGTFGVSDLAATLLPAATDHHDRELATSGRLRRTAAGVGGVVLALVVGLGAFALAPAADPLAERVRHYQQREGPPAVRLASQTLPWVRRELAAIQASPGFDKLPGDLQAFVRDRQREADTYADFYRQFLVPRLGPAEVRSQQQIDALAADLAGPLAVPAEYASEWVETDAGRVAAKWKTDLGLLEAAGREMADWYRSRSRRGDLLLLTETPPDPAWREAVARLLAERPPFDGEIAGSPTAPGLRGKPITWGHASFTDRAAAAFGDWREMQGRLTSLAELCDALGLTAPNAPLQFPDPLPKGLAGQVLTRLRMRERQTSVITDEQRIDRRWRAERFPDPVRGVVTNRLLAAYDTAVQHLLPQLPASADALLADPDFRAWGELLKQLATWAGRPATDPVQELAAFLRRDRFDLDLRDVRVTLPDDLTEPPPVPAGPLTLTHTPAGGSPARLTLAAAGPPTRDRPNSVYRFTGPPLAVRPGDTVSATLPVRVGAETRELVWPAGSGPFAFLRLARPPRLGDAEAAGVSLSAPGLAAPVLLPDPGGR